MSECTVGGAVRANIANSAQLGALQGVRSLASQNGGQSAHPRNSAVDPAEYKACMRRFAGGVNIITSADGDVWAGLTATAVCSLSAYPPRVLCCVNQQGLTLNVIRNTENFCVNILSEAQHALAERFAGMGDIGGDDRFAEGDWAPLKTGAPALAGAIVSLDCILEAAIDCDTHSIIVGSVVATKNSELENPLLWFDGQFTTTKIRSEQ